MITKFERKVIAGLTAFLMCLSMIFAVPVSVNAEAERTQDPAASLHGHIFVFFTDFMELFQYRFHPDRISLQPRCQMRGDCRLIDVRTHLLQRLTDPRHCFYLKSIPRDQTAVRAPLIPAHCRLIVGRVRSALLQLFHDQTGHIRLSDISSRACDKNISAHLLSKSPFPDHRDHPFSDRRSQNAQRDIPRNCQQEAV